MSFTHMVLECVHEFTRKLGFEPSTVLRMANLWTNVNRHGGFHEKHRHENSFLSGTYYVEAGEDAAAITFYDPKAALLMIEPNMDNPDAFTAKVFSVQPSTGTLVLFPSYLEHKVEVQKSALDRLSLSFNIILLPTVTLTDRQPYSHAGGARAASSASWTRRSTSSGFAPSKG